MSRIYLVTEMVNAGFNTAEHTDNGGLGKAIEVEDDLLSEDEARAEALATYRDGFGAVSSNGKVRLIASSDVELYPTSSQVVFGEPDDAEFEPQD